VEDVVLVIRCLYCGPNGDPPAHNNNNNNNNSNKNVQVSDHNMRIMANPIYGVDNNGVGNQQQQQQQQQQQASSRNPVLPPINTSTYSVKDRLSNGNIVFNKLWKV